LTDRSAPFQGDASRPDSAPDPIPGWAWHRLAILAG